MENDADMLLGEYRRCSERYTDEVKTLPTEEQGIAHKAIATVNTPLYAVVAKLLANSQQIADRVHTLIRDEAMYVLFLDRSYESDDTESAELARRCSARARSALSNAQVGKLEAIEKKLFVFWEIEQELRKRMEEGEEVTGTEMHSFMRRKSTDVFVYTTILQFFANTPQEVVLELYTHQLLRDVEDDERDLEEDASEHMPNPLLLQLYREGKYSCDHTYTQQALEVLCTDCGLIENHRSSVRAYCEKVSAHLSRSYRWMSDCSGIKIS
jgi:hypothetical protein